MRWMRSMATPRPSAAIFPLRSARFPACLRWYSSLTRRFKRPGGSAACSTFPDLEHEAIRLLTDRYTGKPTAVAREIASGYREILVDEYQDSNAIQETIFQAVSQSGQNLFMVGDVKQSIYRFRLADPDIFLRKYSAYPDAADAAPGEPRKLLLSDNFRSREEVLAAAKRCVFPRDEP